MQLLAVAAGADALGLSIGASLPVNDGIIQSVLTQWALGP